MKLKLSELISKLQEMERLYGPDINIDCNNTEGIYSSILKVGYQKWTTRNGELHETLSIYHSGYDENDSLALKTNVR